MNNTRAALALVVEEVEVVSRIDAVRREHDHAHGRWMPHVNFLFPFVGEGQLDEAVRALQQALRPVAPFRLVLGEFACFAQRQGVTVHLRPRPEGKKSRAAATATATATAAAAATGGDGRENMPAGSASGAQHMQSLNEHIMAALPQTGAPRHKAFNPHLTLGQWTSLAEALPVINEVLGGAGTDAGDAAVVVEVRELCVLTRPADGPFTVWARVPLGGAGL